MVDINLLPEELRRKEEKEATRKKSPVFEIQLSMPKDGTVSHNKEREGFFAGVLSREEKISLPPKTGLLGRDSSPPLQQRQEHREIDTTKITTPPKLEKEKITTHEEVPKKEGVAQRVTEKKIRVEEITLPPHAKAERKKFLLWERFKSLFKRKKASQKKTTIEIKPNVREKKPLPPVAIQVKDTQKTQKEEALKAFTPKTKVIEVPRILPSEEEVIVPTFGINLIPENIAQKIELDISGKSIALIISIVLSISLVALIYFGLQFYGADIGKKNDQLQTEINFLNREIRKFDEERKRIDITLKRLATLERILDQHVYWTKIFDRLEAYTLKDVFYTNFVASRTGDLMLSARGKDYTSLSRQYVSFQKAKDFVQSVNIPSASALGIKKKETAGKASIDGVSFDIHLKLVPEIFYMRFE